MLLRATCVWLGILVLANLNGALRELLLVPSLGTASAHIFSTLVLSAVVAGVTWLTIRWVGPQSQAEAFRVGGGWLALTLGFEILAGHFLFRKPWTVLLADYDLSAGRIWILVPLVTFFAPPWAWRRRRANA
jgi:hypothetical protein